jgi:SAM-dependent methyltransferase
MFACPYCFSKLDDNLNCSCGYQGMIKDGIYHLHKYDDSWIECEQQEQAHFKSIEWGKTNSNERTAGQTVTEEEIKRTAFVKKELQDTTLQVLGNLEGKLFLDVGCSEGTTVAPFVSKAIVVGLDINEKLLHNAKNVIPMVVLGDGRFLPFTNETFDIVFDCASLHHFPDRKLLLNHIYRVLKPGGIYVSVGNPPCLQTQTEIEGAKIRQDWYWKMFGLIEIQPTKNDYEKDFRDLFGNFEFYSVAGDNSIMKGVKN